MRLRTKFILVVGLFITLGIALSNFVVYRLARQQLAAGATTELEKMVVLYARQSKIWMETLKRDAQGLAALVLVQQTGLFPASRLLVDETCRHFQLIVEKARIYQSINLIDRDAWCIASSIPSRIGYGPMRQGVSERPGFQAAMEGRTYVSPILFSMETGRPCIAINVPVKFEDHVIAVIRAVVDLQFFNDEILRPQQFVHGERVFFYSPQLDMSLPEGWQVPDIITAEAYRLPDIPILPAIVSQKKGLVQYRTASGDQLAAFLRLTEPDWFFIVERPLQDMLGPIQTVAKASLAAAGAILLGVFLSVFFLTNPILGRIRRCMQFAQEIGAGRLDRRLDARGKDEIALLAKGLNGMAEDLDRGRAAFAAAEQLYRGIFENAVEAIFVTGPEGHFVSVNPAVARILGHASPAEVIGRRATEYYARGHGSGLRARLQSEGTVKNYEVHFRRQDGTVRVGSIYARADLDPDGNIVRIQGILDDITEEREMARERRRAEEAERRLILSRLESLRYQLNPHFLFNILNTIDALSRKAPERIAELISQLACYLRFTLASSERSFVALRDELEAIESYLRLEKMRFEDGLDVTVDVSQEVRKAAVPDFLLQPLVENAIKYGHKTSPLPLKIALRGLRRGAMLRMEVANSGHWISREPGPQEGGRVGLENLRKRLALLYPQLYRMGIAERSGWVVVTLEIPFREDQNDSQA